MNDANGGASKLLGLVKNIPINIGHIQTTMDAYVAKDPPFDGRLGRPWAADNLVSIEERNDGTYLTFPSKGSSIQKDELYIGPRPKDKPAPQPVLLAKTDHLIVHSSLPQVYVASVQDIETNNQELSVAMSTSPFQLALDEPDVDPSMAYLFPELDVGSNTEEWKKKKISKLRHSTITAKDVAKQVPDNPIEFKPEHCPWKEDLEDFATEIDEGAITSYPFWTKNAASQASTGIELKGHIPQSQVSTAEADIVSDPSGSNSLNTVPEFQPSISQLLNIIDSVNLLYGNRWTSEAMNPSCRSNSIPNKRLGPLRWTSYDAGTSDTSHVIQLRSIRLPDGTLITISPPD